MINIIPVPNAHGMVIASNGTCDSRSLSFASTLAQQPRPYQWEGTHFLQEKKKGMIADPPGLGKTLQAMMAASDGEHIGISCPSYLTEHWWDQIRMQFPNDTVVLAGEGTRSTRNAALELSHAHTAKWTIFNHQMLRFKKRPNANEVPMRDDLKFDFPRFDTLIYDESHHFRNRSSQQAKGAYVLSRSCPRVFLLTGTPIMREADDLFMQLRIMDPVTFSSYWQFVNTYCNVEQTGFGTRVYGQRGTLLKGLMSRYALRRTYEDVGLYLPPIIGPQYIKVDFTAEHEKKYKEAWLAFRVNDIWLENYMQVMHVLRALTGVQEKLNATIELARDMDKFLIFCWYKHHARAMAQALDATLIISDEVPPNERKALVASSERVVCTLGSLSEGVDASHLRNVIYFEEHYTPGSIEQSTARVQRWSEDIAATNSSINLYVVMVRNTIDETINNIWMQRRSDNRGIIRDASAAKLIMQQEMARR